jgi:hypothetical protein
MSQAAIDAGTVSVAAKPVAAAEAPVVVLPSDPVAPVLLAGKFKSQEELEKGYKELEKKLGAPKVETPPATPIKKPITPEGIAKGEAAVASAGLDMATLTSEYAEKGELSETSIAALAKVGIPKEMVDDYIAGQEARAVAQVSKVHALVGGEAEYKALVTWAATNLSDADKTVFNKNIAADFDSQRLVVESLQGKYIKAVGSAPKGLIMGEGAPPVGQGYESRAQMTTDMSDPRYAKDSAFRAKVIEKLSKTTAF